MRRSARSDMSFVESGAIRYYRFELLEELGVIQAIFTRRGGVSQKPFDSLNVGGTIGDEVERVRTNRRLSFAAVGRGVDTLYDVWQVHSSAVVCADMPRPASAPHLKADVLLTDRPQVTLFMRFADCVPIFLVDPVRRVIGIAHAGWKGTVQWVARGAVYAMKARYGCCPEDIHAGIGPSIGVDHYPIGPDVASQVRSAFGQDAGAFLLQADGRVHFDLWAANRFALEEAGVRHIQVAELCTACHTDDWYSHRGEGGKTGRFGALLALAD